MTAAVGPTPGPTLGLSLPLFNEDALVVEVVEDILAVADLSELSVVLALVDNGSQDGTGDRIRTLALRHPERILTVHLPENQGYGGGILAGLQVLQDRVQPRLLGWCWGDGQVDPAVLPVLVQLCDAGASLAKARRVQRLDGLARKGVSAAYAAVLAALGCRVPDVNGCPKVFAAGLLQRFPLTHRDWFLDAELVLALNEAGEPIVDAPTVMAPRRAGRSKVRLGTLAEFVVNLGRRRLQL